MLTDKKSVSVILKGGILSAAFSFIFLAAPLPGVAFRFFTLAPLFYVGVRLGFTAFAMAAFLPVLGFFALAGLTGGTFFLLTAAVPSALIIYRRFGEKGGKPSSSDTRVLHDFSKFFLIFAVVACFYAKITATDTLATFGIRKELLVHFSGVAPALVKMAEFLPGIFCFSSMATIWLNYRVALAFATKGEKSALTKYTGESLPWFWDMILVGGLWSYWFQKILAPSVILSVFAKTILCVALFPLLIEGFLVLRAMAGFHKLPMPLFLALTAFAFLLVWPAVFVVALGLVEPLFGLKRKYVSKSGA